MKIYKKGSAAAARPKKPLDQHGRIYLHPERHKDYLDKMERKLARKYTKLITAG